MGMRMEKFRGNGARGMDPGEAGKKADLNDRLIFHLRNVSHTMRALYEGKGSKERVLMVMDESGGSITQRELTGRLGIRPGSASEVIAKLEDAGYISRSPGESDRRTMDLTLTGLGKETAARARQERAQRHEHMFSSLSEEEKEQLLCLLEKINSDWEERYRENGACHRPCRHHHGKHNRREAGDSDFAWDYEKNKRDKGE